MAESHLEALPEWTQLAAHARRMALPENHLKNLITQKCRFEKFSVQEAGLFYDFTRQRMDTDVLKGLLNLANSSEIMDRFSRMMSGELVNTTEKRAALHTATRSFSSDPLMNNGMDVMPDIRRIRDEIKTFSDNVHNGKITTAAGQLFTDVVVIGIGGSYLGTEFVATALNWLADKKIRLHFLSNVDIDNFGTIANNILPETCLWIVISKSYTTAETLANTNLVLKFLGKKYLKRIEELSETKIDIVSVGPGREETIILNNIF